MDIQLEIFSTYHLLVAVFIVTIKTLEIWVPTPTIGHLRQVVKVTHTICTSLHPALIGRITMAAIMLVNIGCFIYGLKVIDDDNVL